MREISLDTETTGLDALNGDRIVEIGAVELVNHVSTKRVFHKYIDPLRSMSPEATDITGLTDDFLRGKPVFKDVAAEFRTFIGDDPLIIHNAPFDVKFINAEFARLGVKPLQMDRVIDTLPMAKRRFPGAKSTLDALCSRFGIDNSAREKHGALLDAELLAEVYLELLGGRQPGLTLSQSAKASEFNAALVIDDAAAAPRPYRAKRRITHDELTAHKQLIEEMGETAAWSSPDFDKWRQVR